jgi:hypothetical protein
MSSVLKHINSVLPKRKRLVYYCAFGDKYIEMVKINVSELKKYYDGEIIILTNDKININNVLTIKCDFHPVTARVHIDEFVNINNFNEIMYLDVDAIPLKKFNNLWDFNCDINASVQDTTIGKCKHPDCKKFHTYFMNDDEIKKHKNKLIINDGVLITRLNIYKEWRNLCYTVNEQVTGISQSALNKILMNNSNYCEIKELISSELCMHNKIPNGAIHHFISGNIDDKLKRMKKLLNI